MTDGDRILSEFSVASEVGNERVVMDRVSAALADRSLEAAQLDRLRTAVAEAALNAIEHGNRGDATLPVEVRVRASDTTVRVAITDRGGLRDLVEPPAPDLEAKLAGTQRARGWGLYLIEHMVDAVTTTADGDRRTVELVVRTQAANRGDALTDRYGRSAH